MSEWTDRRNGMMSDVLNGIKMIKMFSWEEPFAQSVEECRRYVSLSFKNSSSLSLDEFHAVEYNCFHNDNLAQQNQIGSCFENLRTVSFVPFTRTV